MMPWETSPSPGFALPADCLLADPMAVFVSVLKVQSPSLAKLELIIHSLTMWRQHFLAFTSPFSKLHFCSSIIFSPAFFNLETSALVYSVTSSEVLSACGEYA
jgi:hypothetical protein